MIDRNYADFAWEQAAALLAIDSPSGFTGRAAQWVKQAFENLGFSAEITGKGGVLACLGGEGEGLLLEAHTDTLGGMVSRIKSDGRLELTPIGGMRAGEVAPGATFAARHPLIPPALNALFFENPQFCGSYFNYERLGPPCHAPNVSIKPLSPSARSAFLRFCA